MGPNSTQALILVLFASILGVGIANKDWQLGGWGPKRGYHRPGHKDTPQKIIVGGSANWTFGFNYSVWAFKSGPFFVNDTLGVVLFSFLTFNIRVLIETEINSNVNDSCSVQV